MLKFAVKNMAIKKAKTILVVISIVISSTVALLAYNISERAASTAVISDVYSMFEYVNFLCYWPTYMAEFSEGKDYLYPTDAVYFVQTDGAQYNYGFNEGYFDNIIYAIESGDANAFSDLVATVEKAKALSEKAYNELKAENCTLVDEYSVVFGGNHKQYNLNNSAELEQETDGHYREFSTWLSSWEL